MTDERNVTELEASHGPTWRQLGEAEPGLLTLLAEATAAGPLCRDEWDVEREWAPFKNRVADLVGFHGRHRRHRRHPILGGYKAYEVAYRTLHDAPAGDLTTGV